MNKERFAMLMSIPFVAIFAFGLFNVRPIPAGLPSYDNNWRVKHCDSATDQSAFIEFERSLNIVSWLTGDCDGQDGNVYYAFDALLIGGILATAFYARMRILMRRRRVAKGPPRPYPDYENQNRKF